MFYEQDGEDMNTKNYPKDILTLLAYSKSPYNDLVKQTIKEFAAEEHWKVKKSEMMKMGLVYNGEHWVVFYDKRKGTQ